MKHAVFALMLFALPAQADIPTLPVEVPNPTPEMARYIEDQNDLASMATKSRDPRMNGVADEGHGPFDVTVMSVKDGDTFEVVFKTGPCGKLPCAGSIVGIRNRYIDSGETKSGEGQSNAQCDDERVAGDAAKKFAEQLLAAVQVQVYHYGPDPYNARGVASVRFMNKGDTDWRYYHIEALQLTMPNGGNVFSYYDPKANERLRDGENSAFEKRKIWCGK